MIFKCVWQVGNAAEGLNKVETETFVGSGVEWWGWSLTGVGCRVGASEDVGAEGAQSLQGESLWSGVGT